MLTDEQIVAHWNKHQDVRSLGRFVEVEVRKQDEALIRQMLDAVVGVKDLSMGGELALWTVEFDRMLAAINAARARLEKAP